MIRNCVRLIVVPIAVAGLACKGSQEPAAPALASITVTSTPAKSTIMLGETVQLSAAGKDQNGNAFQVSSFTWTSSNTAVATVDANGLVTARGGGQTIISAASGTIKGDFALTVQGALHSTDVTTNQTWRAADNPHLVTRYISVEGTSGPILTIEAGAVIRFAAGAGIEVGDLAGGSLRATGTATAGITMSADAANPSKGHWAGVYVGSRAGSSELRFVTMSHCGGSGAGTTACIEIAGSSSGAPKLLIDNVTIQNSLTHGVVASGGGGFASGSTKLSVSGGDRAPMHVAPNEAGALPAGGTFTANTPNVILLRAGNVQTSQTWGNHGIPYVASADIYVEGSGAPTLTLAPGVEVRFDAARWLNVGYTTGSGAGNLVANGTASAPIKFTANSATPTAGFWAGLYFGDASSSVSKLNHVIVEYAGGVNIYSGYQAGVTIELDIGAVLTNSTLRFSKDCGVLRVDGPFTTDFTAASSNNTFANNVRDQCGPIF
jgi:hypothetical protein